MLRSRKAGSGMGLSGWVRVGISLVSSRYNRDLAMAYILIGGAICGAFIVFGGLSVLLYKPWRRRVDKKRAKRAHFVPLPQSSDIRRDLDDEDVESTPTPTKDGISGAEIHIAPVETTDAAGPAGGSVERR